MGSQDLLGRPPPSLRKNSMARLFSDFWTLIMALIAATMTARLLGLSGKGYYSSLILLAGAFIQVFSAGLGEAALVLVGQGRFNMRTAAAATMGAIVPLAAIGVAIFLVVARVVLRPSTADARTAAVLAGVTVGVMVCQTTAVSLLLAQERLVSVALLAILQATLSTSLLALLVGPFHAGTRGAVLGGLIAAAATLGAALVFMGRGRILLRPRWVSAFICPAARLGSQMQLSNLLVTLTARVDLIMVYRLRDSSAAGGYSVALTIGALVGIAPIAVSYAVFPRMAWVSEDEARALTTQMFRVGILVALVLTGLLALVTPIALPLAFGSKFRGAVLPTLVLLPAGALSSGQWLLARAEAARGRPTALWFSFAANFATMVTIDVFLIPPLGATGAAVGSLVACVVGFATCAMFYRGLGLRWRSFVPTGADLASLVSVLRSFPAPRGDHFRRS